MAVAVVGAGIAGLSCTLSLAAAGAQVTVFDKGRSAGGRVAARRAGDLRFNHGAQFATARGGSFSAVIHDMAASSLVAPWAAAGAGCWVGLPAMSGLPRHLAKTLVKQPGTEIRLQRHVSFLRRSPAGWHLRSLPSSEAAPGFVSDSGGVEDIFDTVLLAVPPAQANVLLQSAKHDFVDALPSVIVAPCWTLMAAFASASNAPDIQRVDQALLTWIARDSARPGSNDSLPERWVAHASPAWSRDHLEETPDLMALKMLALLTAALGGAGRLPLHLAAHRWRYALTEQALGKPALWDREARLGLCGDWCLGARIEAAWDSGHALAGQVLGHQDV